MRNQGLVVDRPGARVPPTQRGLAAVSVLEVPAAFVEEGSSALANERYVDMRDDDVADIGVPRVAMPSADGPDQVMRIRSAAGLLYHGQRNLSPVEKTLKQQLRVDRPT